MKKSKALRSAPYNNESHLQAEIVKAVRRLYPQYYYRFWSIPNGGFRYISTARKLKKEGALSGVWDLFFSVPASGCGGLFIECKYKYNTLTDEQKRFKEHNPDFAYATVWTVSEAIDAINAYLAE